MSWLQAARLEKVTSKDVALHVYVVGEFGNIKHSFYLPQSLQLPHSMTEERLQGAWSVQRMELGSASILEGRIVAKSSEKRP